MRITIAIGGLKITGWQVADMLMEEHAVIPELASFKVHCAPCLQSALTVCHQH